MVLKCEHARVRRLRWILWGLTVTVPGALAAQPSGCPGAEAPIGWHGITSFVCNCTMTIGEPGEPASWEFRTEPEVLRIAVRGPADGVLEEGDRVVSIDGLLITTRAGGRRWSHLVPGEVLKLRVRRHGSVRELPLTVGSRCPGAMEESRPAEPSRVSAGRRLLPRGWLGFGVECDCSVSAGSEYPRWRFEAAPIVRGLAPSGPAEIAGVQSGDVIVAIDGLPLTSAEGAERFSSVVPGQSIRLTLARNGAESQVVLTAGTHPGGD